MSVLLTLGRLSRRAEASRCAGCPSNLLHGCIRSSHPPSRTFASHTQSPLRLGQYRHRSWRQPPHSPKLASASASGLAAAAFIELSEKDNEGPRDTGEKRMLEVSRDEIKKKISDSDTGLTRVRHQIVFFLDLYIWEPICTGFRFLQLVTIFVPVILTVPAIWIGNRRADRDNERTGTLWWYGFLVQAMEWAGPAFIKVGLSPGLLPFFLKSID